MRGSESRSIAMVLLCLAGLLCTSQARAQEERSREGKHRFSFLMLGAGVGPGPTDDFKKALIRAGFGDDYQWPGGSVRPRPISQSGSGGLGFEIGYEHPSAWGLVLSAGRADFGWAKGFRATSETGEEGQSLVFRYSLRHISPAVTYRLGPLRASLGPSVVQTRTKVDALGPAREIQETIKVGLEASAGVSTGLLLPYLQLGVRARYRLVGSPELGPFNAYDGAIPSFKVNFNHWQVGVGLGLRVESRGTGRSPLSPDISQPGSFADLGRIAGKDAANSRRTFGYSRRVYSGHRERRPALPKRLQGCLPGGASASSNAGDPPGRCYRSRGGSRTPAVGIASDVEWDGERGAKIPYFRTTSTRSHLRPPPRPSPLSGPAGGVPG